MTKFKLKREEVYKLIDGEREFQDSKWSSETTTTGGDHSFEEWLVYIEDYINESKHILAREADQNCVFRVQENMRKIAALAVAAMENLGSVPR